MQGAALHPPGALLLDLVANAAVEVVGDLCRKYLRHGIIPGGIASRILAMRVAAERKINGIW